MKAIGPDVPSSLDLEDPDYTPKILITEDEYIVAFDLQVRLKNLGYEVVGLASSSDDALLQVQDKRPDLVLMDIVLHGEVDGVETARQIRANHDIPVIFITANGDPATLARAGATRPFHCMLKPFREREMKFCIDMALYHHRAGRLLREAHDKLERRVADRTAELDASNKALQQELQQHQKSLAELREAQAVARSADLAKNEFLSTISHELLTPMNGIVGMLEILLENAASPSQREQLGIIQTSAETLLSIINDLLDLSRIEKGTMEFAASAFDLREQIAAYLRPFGIRAKEKSLAFNWTVDPNLPVLVIGDHTRIGQVLANLVNNAVKFTDKGEVEIKITQVAQEDSRLHLRLSVRDTGIGVAEDKQKLIFEPFVQADNSLSRRHEGAGLGLSIASRVASLMGGTVTLESQPRRGSTFHFEVWVGRVRKST